MGDWKILTPAGVEKDFETDYNVRVQEAVGVGMPPIKNVITPYGYIDGGRFQRTVALPRQFTLRCLTLTQNSEAAHLTAMKNMIELVKRDRQAAEGPVTIRFVYSSTKLDIFCYYASGLEGGSPFKTAESFGLQFVAPDPFWYESTANSDDITANTPKTITNAGTAEAFPIFTIEGTGYITQISNDDTGVVINLNLLINTGETVTIDLTPGQKTITSSVRGNLLNSVQAGSALSTWSLLTGDNDVTITAVDMTTTVLAVNAAGDVLAVNAAGDELAIGSASLNLTTLQSNYKNRHWSIYGVV